KEIGVGDGGLRSAEPVAGRAGLGAGAARPDLQEPDLVHVRDRAAAGADLDQLDRRDADRQAAALDEPLLARRLEAVRRARLAAARSNSRISGPTSCDAAVKISGWRSAMRRTASASWLGFA